MLIKDVKILYMGTPKMSSQLLEHLLINNFNIIGILAQEDQLVGRKQILEEVPTKVVGKKYNIPVFQVEKLRKNPEVILDLDFDLILCFAYGQIVPISILEKGKYKPLNFHGSLLPKYRGAAPIQYSLFNGDKQTGVCLMEMVDKMDAGDVYAKEIIDIDESDNYGSLSEKIVAASIKLVDYLQDYVDGKLIGIKQNEEEATFSPSIKKEMERIDLNKNIKQINGQIRGLSPQVGAYLYIGEMMLKIYEARVLNEEKSDCIPYISRADKGGLHLKTTSGTIELLKVQKPGKNIIGYKDFINGERDLLGKTVS